MVDIYVSQQTVQMGDTYIGIHPSIERTRVMKIPM